MESIHISPVTPPEVVKEIKGVIFDCDGVLINSFESNKWYYNKFKEKFDLDPMTADEEKFVHAHTHAESLKQILPKEIHEQAFEFCSDPLLKEGINYIQVEDGLSRLLEWLRTHNIRMGINTNRTDTLPLVLQKFDIEGFFSPMVTSTTLPNSKPHPEGVHYILDKWNMKPEEVVYIGDTWVDESCAERAGVEFWAYRSPTLNARFHVDSYWTLCNLLEKARNDVWAGCGCGQQKFI
ncbi:HAD family hydrolase [Desulfovibrio sp. JC022]|uniref:HAD family hydrolase n=1 Tax=Desulfovibrio sp. JC022 TaxID=2593642 RepID=UPI0013D7DBC6|nr:HAD family hydrolase [Desulfovibrio sp. JC022]NDV21820.1 HAD family hydrolase [Desulfovibrio sp. JC022]